MSGWLLVDRHSHRIAKVPADLAAPGAWAMYCPGRGPDSLIYVSSWGWVLAALSAGTACPHDDLLYRPTETAEVCR